MNFMSVDAGRLAYIVPKIHFVCVHSSYLPPLFILFPCPLCLFLFLPLFPLISPSSFFYLTLPFSPFLRNLDSVHSGELNLRWSFYEVQVVMRKSFLPLPLYFLCLSLHISSLILTHPLLDLGSSVASSCSSLSSCRYLRRFHVGWCGYHRYYATAQCFRCKVFSPFSFPLVSFSPPFSFLFLSSSLPSPPLYRFFCLLLFFLRIPVYSFS